MMPAAFMSPLSWLRKWADRLRPAPLALWGKLPTHADYLRHATRPDAARAWQDWLARHSPPPVRRATAPDGSAWLQLSPTPVDLRAVPVAFVLPPGTLAFSGRQHVAGVMADSCDSLGRRHPLLVFRCVSLAWVLEQAARPGLPWWHAQAQLVERWALRVDASEPADISLLAWPLLCRIAMQIDAAPPADSASLHHSLNQWLPDAPPASGAHAHTAHTAQPASHYLSGVRHLPWALWPQGEHGVAQHPAFWQQSGDARIVSAANTLAAVLRSRRAG